MDDKVLNQLISDKEAVCQIIAELEDRLGMLLVRKYFKNILQNFFFWLRKIFLVTLLLVCVLIFIALTFVETNDKVTISSKYTQEITLDIKMIFLLIIFLIFLFLILQLISISREYKLYRIIKQDTEFLTNIYTELINHNKQLRNNLKKWKKIP